MVGSSYALSAMDRTAPVGGVADPDGPPCAGRGGWRLEPGDGQYVGRRRLHVRSGRHCRRAVHLPGGAQVRGPLGLAARHDRELGRASESEITGRKSGRRCAPTPPCTLPVMVPRTATSLTRRGAEDHSVVLDGLAPELRLHCEPSVTMHRPSAELVAEPRPIASALHRRRDGDPCPEQVRGRAGAASRFSVR